MCSVDLCSRFTTRLIYNPTCDLLATGLVSRRKPNLLSRCDSVNKLHLKYPGCGLPPPPHATAVIQSLLHRLTAETLIAATIPANIFRHSVFNTFSTFFGLKFCHFSTRSCDHNISGDWLISPCWMILILLVIADFFEIRSRVNCRQ